MDNNYTTKQLVSAIVPVLNEKDTISNLILSMHNQNYRPLELLIVDGGSKDGTIDIVNTYINDLNDELFSIKLFKEEDFGTIASPANARNIGLDTATGEYVFFVDSDISFIDKITLKTAISELGDRDFIIIYCEPLIDTKLEGYISKTIMGMNGIFIFKSDFISKTRFIPTLGLGEDREFNYRLFGNDNLSKFKVCTISMGRHYPHTKNELKKQAKWYGRTVVRYLKVIWAINKKDFLQQMLYSIYNVSMAFFPFAVLISIIISLDLTFVLLLLLLAMTLLRFFIYRLSSINEFVFLMWYSIYYGIFFTKGLISNIHKSNIIGRQN